MFSIADSPLLMLHLYETMFDAPLEAKISFSLL